MYYSNRDRQDRPCPSKSISSQACVHYWSSSIRNQAAGKALVSFESSNPFSIPDRCTVSIKAVRWPASKCLKMSTISKSFVAVETVRSAGS